MNNVDDFIFTSHVIPNELCKSLIKESEEAAWTRHKWSTYGQKESQYSGGQKELDTVYSTTNETSGTGYTAGGNTLTIGTAPKSDTSGTIAYLDFSDTTWSSSTITARGALIYKSGGTNPAVAVLDFGADKSSSNSTFKVAFPTASDTTAIIRIA